MNEFDDLWERFLSDQLSKEEQHRLRQLLQTQNQQIPDAIDKMLMDKDLKGLALADREQVLLQRILSYPAAKRSQPAIVRPFPRRRTWIAAAAILLLLATGATLYLNNRKTS